MANDIIARGIAAQALKKAEEGGGSEGLDIVELSPEDFTEEGGLLVATIDWRLPTAFRIANHLLFSSGVFTSNNVPHYTYSSALDLEGMYFCLDVATPIEPTETTTSAVLYIKNCSISN